VARDTASPVPMASLAAQLFRMTKSLRGADADALEITNCPPRNRVEVRLKIIVVMEELICGRDLHG
jgi:hypothetical protein